MTRPLPAILCLLLFAGSLPAAESFAGTWETTYGVLTLTQQGTTVKGTYRFSPGAACTLEGKVEKTRLTFTYQEPDATGEGWFELTQDGQAFEGKWRAKGDKTWQAWTGRRLSGVADRGFAGLWDTSFGKMKLVVQGERVHGIYSYASSSTIQGTLKGKKLTFTYKEPEAQGEGEFELAADEASFTGKWREKGKEAWQQWIGKRVQPVPGRLWLVVVEARWEESLADKEYAFGDMLRAFFARSSQVEVRHRFYTDEDSLRKWCSEIAYLPEPAVLVLATHACPQGIAASGKVIGAAAIADSLRYATNLRLLHFSACEAIKGRLAESIHERAGPSVSFPISGYTKTVDWAGSAIIEFTYLDMVLMRGMSPATAAEQVPKLLTFAREKNAPETVFGSAGFRLVMPPGKK